MSFSLSSFFSLASTYLRFVIHRAKCADYFRDGANKKQVKTRDYGREKGEGGRNREKMGEKDARMRGGGKRWSARARATRSLHHLLHRCIEDVAPGPSQGHHMLTVCRTDITGLWRFYCFKYRTCRACWLKCCDFEMWDVISCVGWTLRIYGVSNGRKSCDYKYIIKLVIAIATIKLLNLYLNYSLMMIKLF